MYLLAHKCVRNDEHCPNCRKYYISIHDTFDDIKNYVKYKIKSSKNRKKLYINKELWIDEWIRRANGDLYTIVKISPNKIYNLHDPTDSINNGNDIYDYNLHFTHIFLHVNINNNNECPRNINYKISFHTSYDMAFKNINKNKIHVNKCVSYHNDGDYYNIIEIEKDNEIPLNGNI